MTKLRSFATTSSLPPEFDKSAKKAFALLFEFKDDLFIGEVTRGTSFKKSGAVIPGATLKGALAKFLNAICGESQIDRPIDRQNMLVKDQFSSLVKHYSALLFTHAFPAPKQATARPVSVPLSAVELKDRSYKDLAVSSHSTYTRVAEAPAFKIDWKDPHFLDSQFGWANLNFVNKTRAAIHSLSRTAYENRLYTFQYISPFSTDAEGGAVLEEVKWLSNIRLPDNIDEAEAKQLWDELAKLLSLGWDSVGKRDARFVLQLLNGPWPLFVPMNEKGFVVNNKAIITLQTDALLFDARNIKIWL